MFNCGVAIKEKCAIRWLCFLPAEDVVCRNYFFKIKFLILWHIEPKYAAIDAQRRSHWLIKYKLLNRTGSQVNVTFIVKLY